MYMIISIHALFAEGDAGVPARAVPGLISIPPLCAGAHGRAGRPCLPPPYFNPRPLASGGRRARGRCAHSPLHFYPRPLRRGRRRLI